MKKRGQDSFFPEADGMGHSRQLSDTLSVAGAPYSGNSASRCRRRRSTRDLAW